MARLAKPLREFLERIRMDEEVREDVPAGMSSISTVVNLAGQSCPLSVVATDHADMVSVFCFLPFNVVPGHMAQACVLANAFNREDALSHLEIDPDGEVSCVSVVVYEGLEPTGANVAGQFHACVLKLRDWIGTIAEVAVVGRSAAEALFAREAAKKARAGDPAAADVWMDGARLQ